MYTYERVRLEAVVDQWYDQRHHIQSEERLHVVSGKNNKRYIMAGLDDSTVVSYPK